MSRSGIVNVRMVITEEKILSNIDKVHKLINPNSKKQIVQLIFLQVFIKLHMDWLNMLQINLRKIQRK